MLLICIICVKVILSRNTAPYWDFREGGTGDGQNKYKRILNFHIHSDRYFDREEILTTASSQKNRMIFQAVNLKVDEQGLQEFHQQKP